MFEVNTDGRGVVFVVDGFWQVDQCSDALCLVGKKRGMVIRGGEVDTLRAANMLLEEFRNCKIGRITLEGTDFYA